FFTRALDQEGLETPAFVINPFTALLVEMVRAQEIDIPTARKYALQVLEITETHAKLIESTMCDMNLKYEKDASGTCFGIDQEGGKSPAAAECCELAADVLEGWPIVVGYAPQQLEELEDITGFYSCDYFVNKYFSGTNLDSLPCEEFKIIASKLRRGECADNHPAFNAMQTEFEERCIVSSGPSD